MISREVSRALISAMLGIDYFIVEKMPVTQYRTAMDQAANILNGLNGAKLETLTPEDQQFKDEMDYLRVKHLFEVKSHGAE